MRRFIVVEGLIGVGKTSLCRLLEQEWGARLVLEPSETNPFLEPFYEDPDRYSFPVQIFYLMNRWRQQDEIRQEDLFSELVVADYLFIKDRLFAEKTLEGLDMEMYERFAGVLGAQAPVPDLLIFLDAPVPTLMKRIARRQAPGEWAINEEYLVDLRQRYAKLLAEWTHCPVLHLDNQDMNYVDEPAGRVEVLRRITEAMSAKSGPGAPGSMTDREAQTELFGAGSSPGG